MVIIASKRLELSFDKKFAKSLEPFLRYLQLFFGNILNLVFQLFDYLFALSFF